MAIHSNSFENGEASVAYSAYDEFELTAGGSQVGDGNVDRPRQFRRRVAAMLAAGIMAIGAAVLSSPVASADQYVCGYWIRGAIEGKWLEKGGLGGPLGCPTTDELTNPDGDGKRTHFADRGHIYWRNYTGAHPVWGMIYNLWAQNGWEQGLYRYPNSDEWSYIGAGNMLVHKQNFECGTLIISNGWPGANYICD
ncbi:hypothetical protein [Nocardia fluminea]|uniref:hypothetical protein n=1 Tax=Nocardia fluminea TaxID=134984 RepID=UPI0036682868